jgi:hypothetical protein
MDETTDSYQCFIFGTVGFASFLAFFKTCPDNVLKVLIVIVRDCNKARPRLFNEA